MINSWEAYFIFSEKERKGIIVLGVILTLSIVFALIVPHKNNLVTKKVQLKDFNAFKAIVLVLVLAIVLAYKDHGNLAMIAFCTSINSSLDNCNFGLAKLRSSAWFIGIKCKCA